MPDVMTSEDMMLPLAVHPVASSLIRGSVSDQSGDKKQSTEDLLFYRVLDFLYYCLIMICSFFGFFEMRTSSVSWQSACG